MSISKLKSLHKLRNCIKNSKTLIFKMKSFYFFLVLFENFFHCPLISQASHQSTLSEESNKACQTLHSREQSMCRKKLEY